MALRPRRETDGKHRQASLSAQDGRNRRENATGRDRQGRKKGTTDRVYGETAEGVSRLPEDSPGNGKRKATDAGFGMLATAPARVGERGEKWNRIFEL